MKILALRVKNLTSLAEEVTIDFELAPLAQAGLFAIVGPTGAGKSTLLDALCLALYNKLPRSADVRSVLRHGSADAYAKVDFVGRDGGRYQAHWQLRRARNRIDGTIQSESISLTDLITNTVLGDKKTDTLAAIRDKVGLDYDQFRRSVLLAQNDFDAFLKANPGERADLLELMTGTEIYGDLSTAAFDRHKTEAALAQALEEELKRVNVLADDERTIVESNTSTAQATFIQLNAEKERLTKEISWHETAAQLAERVAQAQTQLSQASTNLTEAQTEREHIEQVRTALALVPLVKDFDRTLAEKDRLTTEYAKSDHALIDCNKTLDTARDHSEKARHADDLAESLFKAAGPNLDQAAALDARITEGQQRIVRYQEAVQSAQDQIAQVQLDVDHLTAEHATCEQTIAQQEQWQADHHSRKSLAEQPDRWQELIAEHSLAEQQHQTAALQETLTTQQLKQLADQIQLYQRQVATHSERLTALNQNIEDLDQQLNGIDQVELDQRRDGLTALGDALSALKGLSDTASTLDHRAIELTERSHTEQTKQAQAQDELNSIARTLQKVAGALPEAQASLALAEAAESEQAKTLRQRLIDDQPCPVCGSREHPMGQVLSSLLTTLHQRVKALVGERDKLNDQRAAADAIFQSSSTILEHISVDLDQLADDRQVLADRWSKTSKHTQTLADKWQVPVPTLPNTPLSSLDLTSSMANCTARHHDVTHTIQTIRTANADRQKWTHELELLRQESQQLTNQLTQAEQEQIRIDAQKQTAYADNQRALAQIKQVIERLTPLLSPLPNWLDLLATPDQLTNRLGKLAQQWQQTADALELQRETERELASQCDSATHALNTAQSNAEKERTTLANERAGHGKLIAARAPLFNGRPTGEVRTELNEARKQSKAYYQLAQDALTAAVHAQSAAQNQRQILAEMLELSIQATNTALSARDAALFANDLTVAQIRDAMTLGEQWLSDANAHQDVLRHAEVEARAVLTERQQSLITHQSTEQPDRTQEQLAAQEPMMIAQVQAAQDELTRLQQQLEVDNRNRDAAASTRQRIAQHRTTLDLWKGMTDLIGSADGKKFRLFAQGLTLDRLLGLANLHLTELTPRYILQRVSGSNMDLQVIDRDMADEIRSVANLSGGERFLISLSLALGLATMSGSHTLAESLFIDEGFGALDAESLDIAIGALETLHASGRKVGVISHVQAMTDRIGVQIRITKQGGGRSAVEILAM